MYLLILSPDCLIISLHCLLSLLCSPVLSASRSGSLLRCLISCLLLTRCLPGCSLCGYFLSCDIFLSDNADAPLFPEINHAVITAVLTDHIIFLYISLSDQIAQIGCELEIQRVLRCFCRFYILYLRSCLTDLHMLVKRNRSCFRPIKNDDQIILFQLFDPNQSLDACIFIIN